MVDKNFDINKFPKGWGIIIFPISMSRIGNAQKPEVYADVLDFFLNKISETKVGVQFMYTEGLYMNLEENAHETKNKFAQTSVSHMRGVKKLIEKYNRDFQIESAFSFESWFQMYLSHKDFFATLKQVRDFYDKNQEFQQLIAEDAKEQGKELTEEQISFYLEEHLFAYLAMNRQLSLKNNFVEGREEWVLLAYPGKPPKAQMYLVQKDPLNLNSDSNQYKGQYDLEEKVFVPYI